MGPIAPRSTRRARAIRPVIGALAAGAVAAVMSGCDAKPAIDVLRAPATGEFLRLVRSVGQDGAKLSDVAAGLSTTRDLATTFEKIAGSEDPYGEALLRATCNGLAYVADQAQSNPDSSGPTPASWASYLTSQLTEELRNLPITQVQTVVTEFNNAAELASINPPAASIYVRECRTFFR